MLAWQLIRKRTSDTSLPGEKSARALLCAFFQSCQTLDETLTVYGHEGLNVRTDRDRCVLGGEGCFGEWDMAAIDYLSYGKKFKINFSYDYNWHDCINRFDVGTMFRRKFRRQRA